LHTHTRIKLKLLKKYFDICHHYHKDNLRKFYHIDTYAGDGYTEFGNEKALGSPLLAIQKGFQCFLLEKNKRHFKKLGDNISDFLEKSDIKNEKVILGILNKDCNTAIEEILKEVPPYCHSLFFLDPFAPKDLKWNTVQKIIEHEYKFKSPRDMPLRRPELIINLPISGIKRITGKLKDEENNPEAKKAVGHVTDFFGSIQWKEIWKKYEMDRVKGATTSEESRDALKNLHIGNFEPQINEVCRMSHHDNSLEGNPIGSILMWPRVR